MLLTVVSGSLINVFPKLVLIVFYRVGDRGKGNFIAVGADAIRTWSRTHVLLEVLIIHGLFSDSLFFQKKKINCNNNENKSLAADKSTEC